MSNSDRIVYTVFLTTWQCTPLFICILLEVGISGCAILILGCHAFAEISVMPTNHPHIPLPYLFRHTASCKDTLASALKALTVHFLLLAKELWRQSCSNKNVDAEEELRRLKVKSCLSSSSRGRLQIYPALSTLRLSLLST